MNNFVGLSKIGLVRQRNEDRFFIDGPICAVTDGMVDIVAVKSLVPMLLMKLKSIWPPLKQWGNKIYVMLLFMPMNV